MENQPELTGPPAALAHAWGQYRVWANTSRKLKSQLTTWRTAVLIFTLLGAVLGILSSQLAELDEVDELERTMEGVMASTIPEEKRKEQLPDMNMSAQDYLEKRVRDQIDYYNVQARKSEVRTEWGKWTAWTLGMIGVALGAVGSIFGVNAADP